MCVGRFSLRPSPESGVQMASVADPFSTLIEMLDRATGMTIDSGFTPI
jgi:hypothetical protein